MNEDIIGLIFVAIISLFCSVVFLWMGIIEAGPRPTLFCATALFILFGSLAVVNLVLKCRRRYESV